MNRTKRVVGGIATTLLLGGSGALLATPAHAAGIPQDEVVGTPANTYLVQTKDVTDGGGQTIRIKVLWTETYETAAGNFRVGVKVLSVNALNIDLDKDGPGDGGLDVIVNTYQGYATAPTKLIQSRNFDGVDDPFSFNNANPLNRPGKSKVVIEAGVNDDGHRNSLPATFVQPVIGNEYPGADPTSGYTPAP